MKNRPSTDRTKKSVEQIYTDAAKNLRQWLKPNLKKGWPKRSMDDDLAQAASLLDAAALTAKELFRGR